MVFFGNDLLAFRGEIVLAKSEPVQILIRPVHQFRVFPGRDYAMSLGEMAVLHTSPMQRLKGLRQIGLGCWGLPTAEHTRLAHSLGTTYWAAEFLTRLRTNVFSESVGDGCDPPGNRQRLEQIDDDLGTDLSLDLIVRLFALVHDMTLLPLGHTLQFQSGYYTNEQTNLGRARSCFKWINNELKLALQSVYENGKVSQIKLADCLRGHLRIVERLFHFRHGLEEPEGRSERPRTFVLPEKTESAFFPLVIDLIASTFSADLVDFALRDSLGAGMPRSFDEGVSDYLCIYAQPMGSTNRHHRKSVKPGRSLPISPNTYRLGLNPLSGVYRHEVVTGVMSLQRVRYELAERVFYHEDKLIADAMMDRVLRLIDEETHALSQETGPFAQTRLLRIGDDDFLKLLIRQEKLVLRRKARQKTGDGTPRSLMSDLITRRLYKEAFRVERLSDLSSGGHRLVKQALQPKGRTELERRILCRIPELNAPDLLVSTRPFSMQAKPSSVLIGWVDGQPSPLMDIARKFGYAGEALSMAERYQSLWSLSVYLHPEARPFASRVDQICRRIFLAKP